LNCKPFAFVVCVHPWLSRCMGSRQISRGQDCVLLHNRLQNLEQISNCQVKVLWLSKGSDKEMAIDLGRQQFSKLVNLGLCRGKWTLNPKPKNPGSFRMEE
jgi:hypothetical protein